MADQSRRRIFNLTNGRCFYCGCKLDFENFHKDHFKAKSKGGKALNNLVPACPDCNIMKSNLGVDSFRKKLNELLHDNIHGRLIAKYYGINEKEIKFYFEEVVDGTVQNNINELLD